MQKIHKKYLLAKEKNSQMFVFKIESCYQSQLLYSLHSSSPRRAERFEQIDLFIYCSEKEKKKKKIIKLARGKFVLHLPTFLRSLGYFTHPVLPL